MDKFFKYTSSNGSVLPKQLQLAWRSTILALAAFLFSASAIAQTITVDGNPSDWATVYGSGSVTVKSLVKDNNNTNDSQFTNGSQDPDLIKDWSWVIGNTNDKGDITNSGAALIGCNLYFFGDRTAINGDAQIGFWFFKDEVAPLGSGTTAAGFSGAHQNGDLLILANFTNGGGSASITVYTWQNGNLVEADPAPGAGAVNSSPYTVPNVTYDGVNWSYTPKDGSAGTYPTGAFFEGVVNLCTLYPNGLPCFSSYLMETRNSQSINASLQDLAAGNFDITPAIPLGTGSTITCITTTGTVTVTNPIEGLVYTLSKTGMTPKTITATAGNQVVFTGLEAGTYSLTAKFGACESGARSVVVGQDITPVSAPGAPDVERCGPGAVTLGIQIPVNGVTYNWYATETSTIILETGTSFTTPALTETQTYWVSATGGNGCPSPRTPVQAVIKTPVTVEAGPNQTVCAESPTATLAGSITGGITTGAWVGGTGTFTPNRQTLTATYTPSAAEIAAGSIVLTLLSDNPAGPCDAEDDIVTIFINPEVTVNAGADQIVCATSPAATLAGSISGGIATGEWVGGTGMFTPNRQTLNAVYTPSAAEIAAGTVTLTLQSGDPDGPCEAESDLMTITINPAVVVEAGGPDVLCQSSTAQMVSLTGASVTGGATTGTWTIVSSVPANIGNSLSDNTLASGKLTVAANYTGVITLQLMSADPDGPCPAISDTRTVTIGAAAIVEAGGPNELCQSASAQVVTLSGASITGGANTGTWAIVSSNPVNAGNLLTDNSLGGGSLTVAANYVGVITLQLTSADPDGDGPCVAVSDTRTVTIRPAATVDAGGPYNVTCALPRSVQLNGTFGGGATSGMWSVPAGMGSVTGNVYTPSAEALAAGAPVVLTFSTNDPDGPCQAVSATAVVTFDVCNLEGCTPGYWKQRQHFGNWGCGYVPTGENATTFAAALGLTSSQMSANKLDPKLTLLDALGLNGGKFNALARHAAAAILNACSGDVNYQYSAAQIRAMVQAAFASGNPTTAHNNLAMANESYCPLGRSELTATSTSSLKGIGRAEASDLRAYPTPFSNKATIEFTTAVDESYTVRLYDMKGALVRELKSGQAKAGVVNQVEVDGRSLPEGLYLGRVISDSGSQTVKLLLKR